MLDLLKDHQIKAQIDDLGYSGTIVGKKETGVGVVPLGEWSEALGKVGLKGGDRIIFSRPEWKFKTFMPGRDDMGRDATTTESLVLILGVRALGIKQESAEESRLGEAEVVVATALKDLLRKNPQGKVRDTYLRQLAIIRGEAK